MRDVFLIERIAGMRGGRNALIGIMERDDPDCCAVRLMTRMDRTAPYRDKGENEPNSPGYEPSSTSLSHDPMHRHLYPHSTAQMRHAEREFKLNYM